MRSLLRLGSLGILLLAACGGGGGGSDSNPGATLPVPPANVVFQLAAPPEVPPWWGIDDTRWRSHLLYEDLDGDLRVDVALFLDTQELAVWYGVGDGTFEATVLYGPVTLPAPLPADAGHFAALLFAGDFDGDAKRDVAVVRGSIEFLPPDVDQFVEGWAFVMRNLGGRAFEAGPLTATTMPDIDEGHESGHAADFDGDGRTDLLLMSQFGFVTYRRGKVFLSDGALGFQPTTQGSFGGLALGETNSGRLIGDFDGNGLADVLIVPFFTGRAGILLGAGGGDLVWAGDLAIAPPGGGYTMLETGDVDGDGFDDLVVGIFALGSVSTFLGGPDGALALAQDDVLIVDSPMFLRGLGDLNGDGRADLALLGDTGPIDIRILLATGTGGWTPASPLAYLLPAAITDVPRVLDVDGDGRSDLLLVSDTSIFVLFAQP